MLFAGAVAVIADAVPGATKHLAAASPGWIAGAVAFEVVALAGYAALFHVCFSRAPYLLSRTRSTLIATGELAGFAIVPTGLGGPALRFWALVRSGFPLRTVAVRSVSHGAAFNAPYAVAAIALGVSVALGVGPGHAPLAVALAPIGIVAAAVAITAALTAASRWPRLRGRRVVSSVLAIAPDGLREIPAVLRRPAALPGAFAFWAGDCAVLWASLRACGGSPPVGVVALAYMLGQLGNLLPLPGGVGGVEPLMLGVMTASGVPAGIGAAAVVCYRAIALGLQSFAGIGAVVVLVPSLRESRIRHR